MFVDSPLGVPSHPFIVLPDIQHHGAVGDVVDGNGIEITHGKSCRGGSESA
jgi:hypothetical protein